MSFRLLLAVLLMAPLGSALAENPPLQEMQSPPSLPRPQAPAPAYVAPAYNPPQDRSPADTPSVTGAEQAPAQPPPLDMTPQVQWPNKWVPASAVKLQALDKVNAQATSMTIRVGQPATFGSLTITVRSCLVRPPDQPFDAAAYLAITDSHPDSPGFDGWMLANEPSVSMMQNPIYDIRITGCA